METETDPRDLALHEAFVTWLAEPLDEFYTGQLAEAFLSASTNARELMDRAMHTPSNAWVRVRSPSTTFTEMRSVSPVNSRFRVHCCTRLALRLNAFLRSAVTFTCPPAAVV